MSDRSAIEWTDSTWNPVTGCTKVSPGCKHCYAEAIAERFRGIPGHPYEQGFDLKLWPERLSLPLRWKERRMIFVNSMSDLFHKGVPDEFVAKVFDVMRQANWHIFQVLTKRSERLRVWSSVHFCSSGRLLNGKEIWPENVWAGVSVETQDYVWRIKDLQQVPAKVRFLSVEPLLEPVDLDSSLLEGIHWVIVGGESGPFARPMQPQWVRAIQDQCRQHNVKFFFKQWGTYASDGRRVGKKAAGRILDGQTWDDMPVVLTEAEADVLS